MALGTILELRHLGHKGQIFLVTGVRNALLKSLYQRVSTRRSRER